uniref:hypothetical protein n=1 Tax=Roseivirga sp. TaxID=1964215 RepID=UPI00404844BE
MADSKNVFKVDGKTFHLNVKEGSFFYNSEKVEVAKFLSQKKYEAARKAISGNDLLCSQVVVASDELVEKVATLEAENKALKAENAKLKGGK